MRVSSRLAGWELARPGSVSCRRHGLEFGEGFRLQFQGRDEFFGDVRQVGGRVGFHRDFDRAAGTVCFGRAHEVVADETAAGRTRRRTSDRG